MDTILSQFPGVSFAFAYGSGVIEQTGYQTSNNSQENNSDVMIDIVLVIDEDVKSWHQKNMLLNPTHYTPIIPLSPTFISYLQVMMGARLWYNVFIPILHMPNRQMKYGVISKTDLVSDLKGWDWLYAAGRLHKPVQILKENPEIQTFMRTNYENAVKTALLLMPKTFTELDLFRGIASLSYIGDPRMIAGENPKKVLNLVSPAAMPLYRDIYSSAIKKMQAESIVKIVCPSRGVYTQDMSSSVRWRLCSSLPLTMRRMLSIQGRAKYFKSRPPGNAMIRSALASIVARAASSQSVKGVVTAGLFKCATYLAAKVSKRFSWSQPQSVRNSFHTMSKPML